MKGIDKRKNKNGFVVVNVHYSANPDKDDNWVKQEKPGYPPNKWAREMEISWLTGEGDPVYPRFDKKIHTDWLKYQDKYVVIRGWDFGRRRPACVWLQDKGDIREIHVLSEFLGQDMIFSQFLKEVLRISNEKYPRAKFVDICDPYGGDQKGDKSLYSNIQMMAAIGIHPLYQRSPIESRVQKVERLLEPSLNDGKPGIKFDKSCTLLIAGMNGGMVLDKKEKPKKDKKYEDVHEALCYAIDMIKNLFWWDGPEKEREPEERYSKMGRPLN